MAGVFSLKRVFSNSAPLQHAALPLRSKLSVERGVENSMQVVEQCNVTQMALLIQNLAESLLFGDGVTGDAASGDIVADAEVNGFKRTFER